MASALISGPVVKKKKSIKGGQEENDSPESGMHSGLHILVTTE